MKMRSSDRLNKNVEELRKINSQARALLSKLDNTSFNHTPPKGGWSPEPPPKFKVPAPKIIATVHPDLNITDVTAQYFATHDDLDAVINRARGFDLKKVQVLSPFSGKMSFNFAAALDAVLAHERRHLLQAERSRGDI